MGKIILPRISTADRLTITPDAGEMVYDTDLNEFFYGDGTTVGGAPFAVVGSGIQRSVNVVSTSTGAGAASDTDYVYLVSGTTTITMPTAVGNTNLYTIKNIGTNTITIATTSAQTIDGSSTITILVKYASVDLTSDGANWNII